MFSGSRKGIKELKDQEESDLKFVRFENDKLRSDIDRLSQIVEALWSLLKEETTLEEPRLAARLKEIKERGDPEPEKCMLCERPLPLYSNRCIYCNTEIDSDRVF
ncbi:MAG: hypothetical protein ACI9TH_002452 [Kiritimatiellia bacterium]|jgi:hypothetical protein